MGRIQQKQSLYLQLLNQQFEQSSPRPFALDVSIASSPTPLHRIHREVPVSAETESDITCSNPFNEESMSSDEVSLLTDFGSEEAKRETQRLQRTPKYQETDRTNPNSSLPPPLTLDPTTMHHSSVEPSAMLSGLASTVDLHTRRGSDVAKSKVQALISLFQDSPLTPEPETGPRALDLLRPRQTSDSRQPPLPPQAPLRSLAQQQRVGDESQFSRQTVSPVHADEPALPSPSGVLPASSKPNPSTMRSNSDEKPSTTQSLSPQPLRTATGDRIETPTNSGISSMYPKRPSPIQISDPSHTSRPSPSTQPNPSPVMVTTATSPIRVYERRGVSSSNVEVENSTFSNEKLAHTLASTPATFQSVQPQSDWPARHSYEYHIGHTPQPDYSPKQDGNHSSHYLSPQTPKSWQTHTPLLSKDNHRTQRSLPNPFVDPEDSVTNSSCDVFLRSGDQRKLSFSRKSDMLSHGPEIPSTLATDKRGEINNSTKMPLDAVTLRTRISTHSRSHSEHTIHNITPQKSTYGVPVIRNSCKDQCPGIDCKCSEDCQNYEIYYSSRRSGDPIVRSVHSASYESVTWSPASSDCSLDSHRQLDDSLTWVFPSRKFGVPSSGLASKSREIGCQPSLPNKQPPPSSRPSSPMLSRSQKAKSVDITKSRCASTGKSPVISSKSRAQTPPAGQRKPEPKKKAPYNEYASHDGTGPAATFHWMKTLRS
eukprot:TRINITY_DN4139_c1_g1_i1.p1 TRINITY_DN4139_c1_g1~~TRINITY_DN4139_c1_g1_i1.p1  ORF type:complete len:710 (+),score=99.82 TRINITY_DN4139_c1_g1_i1:1155-3284(+)